LASEDEISGRASLPGGSRVFATDSAVSDGFRTNTSVPFDWSGIRFDPGKTKNWKTTMEGMLRLCNAGRIVPRDGFRIYKRYFDGGPPRLLSLTHLGHLAGSKSKADQCDCQTSSARMNYAIDMPILLMAGVIASIEACDAGVSSGPVRPARRAQPARHRSSAAALL
jgi:hypothetical protein